MELERLGDKFHPSEIEWRVQRTNGDWAHVLPYVTNRAIQNRLDAVLGVENWQNRFRPGPDGGVICGISVRVGDEWITKWDGAENTDIESIKGGLSGSMKRAAVQLRIGRYLYQFEGTQWAEIHEDGIYYQSSPRGSDYSAFRWSPPALPDLFLPEGVFNHPEAIDYLKDVYTKLEGDEEIYLYGGWPEVTGWHFAKEFIDEWAEVMEIDYLLALKTAEKVEEVLAA